MFPLSPQVIPVKILSLQFAAGAGADHHSRGFTQVIGQREKTCILQRLDGRGKGQIVRTGHAL